VLANDVFRVLKNESAYASIDMIMLSFPKLGGSGWGACSLLPSGLPILKKVTEVNLRSLVDVLGEDSNIARLSVKDAEKLKKLASKRAKIVAEKEKEKAAVAAASYAALQAATSAGSVASPTAKNKAKGAAKKANAVVCALPTLYDPAIVAADAAKEGDVDAWRVTFCLHLEDQMEYMSLLDERQRLKVAKFRLITLYAVATGKVRLQFGKQLKEVVGWHRLRLIFKSQVLKSAKLGPRPSDVDFDELNRATAEALDDDGLTELDAAEDGPTNAEIDLSVCELSDSAKLLVTFLEQRGDVPIFAQMPVATALNQTMLAMMKRSMPHDGRLADALTASSALMFLAGAACEQVAFQIPPDADRVASLVSTVRLHHKEEMVRNTPFEKLLAMRVSRESMLRQSQVMIWHVVNQLGRHQYAAQEGPVQVPRNYLVPLVQQLVDKLVADLSLGQQTSGSSDIASVAVSAALPIIMEYKDEPLANSN
jgi:hypothetical protein